jgi:probable rRNA maturation factor
MKTVTVSRTIRSAWSTAGYGDIVRHVLGIHYTVSIVLIGNKKAKQLNKQYRHKNYSANVLTFPLDKTNAEIFLNIAGIKKEAHRFDFTPSQHARYLLIHGCLHLKGFQHSSIMEKEEKKYLKVFS